MILVDLPCPVGWRIVRQRSRKAQLGESGDGRGGPPQLRFRKPLAPPGEEQMVELVGADEVPNRSKLSNLRLNLPARVDRRPQPKPAALEQHDGHSRRIGETEEGNDPAVRNPQIRSQLLKHGPLL